MVGLGAVGQGKLRYGAVAILSRKKRIVLMGLEFNEMRYVRVRCGEVRWGQVGWGRVRYGLVWFSKVRI